MPHPATHYLLIAGSASPGLSSDSTITDGPILEQTAHNELRVSWSSSSPPGTTFQIYLDRRLAWSGTARVAFLPVPTTRVRVWVIAVAPGSELADFGDTLVDPHGAGDRADLAWYGGRYLDPGLVSFNIYGGVPDSGFGEGPFGGGGFGSMPPAATVPASHAGIWSDGFGRGRFGEGGFGSAEVAYSWQSGPLPTGTYTFLVVPVNASGDEGTPAPITLSVVAPPRPPAPLFVGGSRVAYTYDSSTHIAILTWGASPG